LVIGAFQLASALALRDGHIEPVLPGAIPPPGIPPAPPPVAPPQPPFSAQGQ
jgi:hypothetical protein